MKAIAQDRYGSAEVLEFRDIEVPAVGDNDVLVRVRASGCGPDVWHFMTGRPYFARLMLGFGRPKVAISGLGRCGNGRRGRRLGHRLPARRRGDGIRRGLVCGTGDRLRGQFGP